MKESNPFDTANVFSHMSYWWMNPLFFLGYKRQLDFADIPPIPDRLKAEKTTPKFEQSWLDELEKNGDSANLRKAIWRVLWVDLAVTGFIKVFSNSCYNTSGRWRYNCSVTSNSAKVLDTVYQRIKAS